MRHRTGEYGDIPPRHGRLLQKEGYWYYSTREGVDIGPFDTRADAETGIAAFIDYIHESDPEGSNTLKKYRAA